MKVFTSTIYKYKGPNKLDITVKSGEQAFAPTWDMVNGHKSGKITDKQYTQMYREMMLSSWLDNRAIWEEQLNKKEIVLVCYCSPGKFCHRLLLKEIFEHMCKHKGIKFTDGGEI